MGKSPSGSRSIERGVEGGWLVDSIQDVSHFIRSGADGRTAEQAEAMMDPLQKSLIDCTVSLPPLMWAILIADFTGHST